MTTKEAAEKWAITPRRASALLTGQNTGRYSVWSYLGDTERCGEAKDGRIKIEKHD